MWRPPGDEVISRIKSYPAQSGKQRFDPRVRRILSRTIIVLNPVNQIAADIAAGNTEFARERNHDVRKILASARARRAPIRRW